MKIQDIDERPAPNPTRRSLLLGLPAGLALASPLGLLGCGGGTAATGNATPAEPPGPLASGSADVPIELPAALAATAGSLQAASFTGTAAVGSGRATMQLVADGPQLVSVVDGQGNTLLLGWAGAGQPAVSMQSTAAVLLYFGLGTPFLGASARAALRTRLLTQPAVAGFAAVIEAELNADRSALTRMSPGIVDGFVAAAQRLLPAAAAPAGSRMRAQGLVVQPAADQSGLQVVQGDTLNSFFVDNVYVRRAVVFVNREAYTGADGVEHAEDGAPVQVGEAMPLPLPAAVDSVANVVGGWANEYYVPDDPNGFWRSVSDTVALEVAPADAKRTRYSVVVLTAGALMVVDPAAFARLPASQQAYLTGLDLGKNLVLQMLLQDLLAPLFFEMLSSRVGAADKNATPTQQSDAKVLEALAAQMLATLQTRLPEVTEKLSDGSLDAWGAFKAILKACTVDPATGEVSPLLQEFLTQAATLAANALADVGLRSRMLEIATGFNLGNKNVLGFVPVLQIMGGFDKVLGKAALLRIVADSLRSSRMVSWSVVATRAKVVLTPDPLQIPPATPSYPIKAEIVDNDNDEYGNEKGSISFDWTCSGVWGTLYSPVDSGLSSPNRFTTSAVNPTVNYLPNGKKPDPAQPDTVTVRAYFEPIGSGGTRSLIGTATAPIRFKSPFTLKFTPPGPADVPADTDFGLTVLFNEVVPDGASVAWEWSRTGVGSLTNALADNNLQNSYATFQSGSAEGSATVTVKATVTLPATDSGPAQSVDSDPVSTTLNVKKGLKTLELVGSWGIDTQWTTSGGNTFYAMTAYILVPNVAGAKAYQVHLDKPTPDIYVPIPSDRGFDPASPPSGLWYATGGGWWSGLSAISGNAANGGAAESYAYLQTRYAGLTVSVTVTL